MRSLAFGEASGMYGSRLRKTLLKGLPGDGGGGRDFSAGGGLTPAAVAEKKIEWARPVPKAPEEPWDSRGPILRTWRPFSIHFGSFLGFGAIWGRTPHYLRLQHWHSTYIQLGHSTWAFSIGIQY